uniref:Uncharacterized protein n=1 Tax=Anguilla anguilla TaxID=7936 RepID=A0A0E9W6V0_ANGAN
MGKKGQFFHSTVITFCLHRITSQHCPRWSYCALHHCCTHCKSVWIRKSDKCLKCNVAVQCICVASGPTLSTSCL